MNEIEEVKSSIAETVKLLKIAFAIILLSFLAIALAVIFLISQLPKNDTGRVSQTANPVMTTNVHGSDDLALIRARAGRRGYFFKAEFAELMGVSEKTVDRWRDADRIESGSDTDGRVAIPLDAAVLK
jgi:hypothetical protein